MKKHKQFSIVTSPMPNDLVTGLLWEMDIEGINETEEGLIVFADDSASVTIDEINKYLERLKKENLIESFSVDESSLEEINWNEEWEKTINIIRISDSLVIKPTFKNYEASSSEKVITIDPKMSFGTGEHETTKLMLQFLEETELNGKSVLDVGSGTAVLAITAVILGADNAVAIDNDEWCYINGIENVKRNFVEDRVKIVNGEINNLDESHFDVVVANINKNILLEISGEIKDKIAGEGELFLSGILSDDENEIKEIYKKKGFHCVDKKRMNEWTALKFRLTQQINY